MLFSVSTSVSVAGNLEDLVVLQVHLVNKHSSWLVFENKILVLTGGFNALIFLFFYSIFGLSKPSSSQVWLVAIAS